MKKEYLETQLLEALFYFIEILAGQTLIEKYFV